MSTDSTLSPERWADVQAIFHAALERTEAERARYLTDVCSGDQTLRSEVESLLKIHEGGGPLGPLQSQETSSPDPSLARIGRYRIERLLGEGGMGLVYKAVREGENFTQMVALKLVRAGFADAAFADRIEAERRILARLEHPGIARLIDGGTTDAGLPYIAMEYVEGATFLDYSDRKRLSINERIKLFIDVCDAVHHAHQRLVVHRDLKPNNILVSNEGRAKLLDFGIAKLVEPPGGRDKMTATAAWFTPAYASPEQVRGEPANTLSDVYSLGVLFCELLSGQLPYEFTSFSPAEVARVVCDEAPTTPSALLTQPTATGISLTELGYTRSTTPERLKKELSGDLDTIAIKALAKDPTRRYSSVEQFADDLRRYLGGQPVLARSDTVAYRTSKFVKRHRIAVTLALVAAVSLVGGALIAAGQAAIASAERDRARNEAQKAAQVSALMVDMFRLSDPNQTLGDTVTARQILDSGTRQIEAEFGDQPVIQAGMFSEVASVYANIGLLPRAESLAVRSLQLKQELFGPASLEVSEALGQVGDLLAEQGNTDQAIVHYRRAIRIRENTLAAPDTMLALIQSNLAWRLRSVEEYQEARELFRRALETQRALLGDDRPEVASTMLGLASTYHDAGQFDSADSLFQRALAEHETNAGRPHPLAATAALNIGMLRRIREQFIEAEPFVRSALSMRSALYQPGHHDVIEATREWANVLVALGRYTEARRLLENGLVQANQSLGPTHRLTAGLHDVLAGTLTAIGRYADAIAHYDTALSIKRARLGPDHADLMFSTIRSVDPLVSAGRFRDADERLADVGTRLSGSPSVAGLLTIRRRGILAHRQGRLTNAQQLFDEAIAMGEQVLPRDNHRYLLTLRRQLAMVLLDRGDITQPSSLLEGVFAAEQQQLPEPHARLGYTLTGLGTMSLSRGQYERAEATLRRALANFNELPKSHWRIGEARSLLGASLRKLGREMEGDELLREGHAIVSAHLGENAFQTRRAEDRLNQP